MSSSVIDMSLPYCSAGVSSYAIKYYVSGSPSTFSTFGVTYPHFDDGAIDYDGHGSHTASTAAGNFVDSVPVFGSGAADTFDISGVAPHANIIAYGACCTLSALTAAIDQTLTDGVDAITRSIGLAVIRVSRGAALVPGGGSGGHLRVVK